MNTLLIVLLTAGAALFFVFILHEARRAARFLLAFGGLAVAGVMAYALVAQANATRQVARVAEVQAMTNAATTLTLFLLVLIILLVLGITGAIVVFRWWQKYREQQRLAEAMRMLQMQALLNGQMPQRIQGLPAPFQPSVPPVIIVPQYQPWLGSWVAPSLPDPQQGWGWPFSEE